MDYQELLDNPIIQGDCLSVLRTIPDKVFNCCVTSPPYWGLRDYGVDGQLGLEPTPEEYVANMVNVFREVRRVLRDDGTLWLNLGDSYFRNPQNETNPEKNAGLYANRGAANARNIRQIADGCKPKDLVGIPWMVAFALRADGWYLRSDIIWNKPNPMPESVTDRPTKAHEYIFLLSKNQKYYYDKSAIEEQVTDSTIARLSQNIENQQGSERANGGAKTNGNMKAVGLKQDELGKRTYSGFNERYFGKGKANSFARKVNESPPPGQQSQHRPYREDIEYTGTRNKRTVWTVATQPFSEAHFATFPEKLIEPCILAGSPRGGIVLDPFGGSGTTRRVALANNRECVLIELNSDYIEIQKRRTDKVQINLF